MDIAKNAVVSIDYTLTDDDGEIIDSSDGEGPLVYLHGYGQLVPGLENELNGKTSGAAFKISIPPKEGYGEHDSQKLFEVEAGELPDDLEPELGMELTTDGPDGEEVSMWVSEITDNGVILDANHPLAGQTLHFAIQVRDVRAATAEEIEHGHAHGPDGEHDH